jgi:hypothetical protein
LNDLPEKHLNIISFDIPYPPNYGGMIDVFYKIKALKENGVKIHLHCFEYGRPHSDELNKLCETVNYYKRKNDPFLLFNKLPYIVITRQSSELIENLKKNNYSILFEGLHCCYYLDNIALQNRKKIVRMHNIEDNYYQKLSEVEKNVFKKWYLTGESKKLKRYEPVLKNSDLIAAISSADSNELSRKYKNTTTLTAFHSEDKISSKIGRGDFAFYHGSLSVSENSEAALFLVNKIFHDINVPLVIAGNSPPKELVNAVKKYKHIELRQNISTEKIHELIQEAQINILPTFQATGLKLKLLIALYKGRHCIVNTPMVENTGLETLCSVKDSPKEMKDEVIRLFDQAFDNSEIKKRETILLKNFSNIENAKRLIDLF